MLLIIQIILTVKAWRNYKAWALLPLGCAFFIGFLIALSDPEMAENDDFLSLIWLDIIAIGALGWMIAKAKVPEELEEYDLEESELEQEENSSELAYDQPKLPLNP
jgi:hypothetical protein